MSKAGPSIDEQKQALKSAGIEDFSEYGPVYVDEIPRGRNEPALPQRDNAIRSLEAGDVLVIASAARLGSSEGDVLQAMKAIGERSAVIYDVKTGETIVCHPDAIKVLEYAQKAESENRKEIAQKMRRAREASGRVGGPPEKLGGDRLREAKRLWEESSLSKGEIAKKFGVTVRTLYRRLGDRGGKQFGSK
ncbi:hypothetical protein GCM10011491_41410 [Brucella endophytica]|uniref:Resolvase/invertase-type recombinase catalytic domain-containing protein n=1 Tax=Brucella endophytica TaxID=1963359 RepID=A0A916SR36_9HYPH|nr:recombinase family protein [Brucella endophytica]GGB09165.1 hypothetical protein GCM10011491_41410 [Brucella endophytica]